MTSRDFVYWLQGYLEIASQPGTVVSLDATQVACIARHLSMVFVHEIDPSFPKMQQAKLDAAHFTDPKFCANPEPKIGGTTPDGLIIRC